MSSCKYQSCDTERIWAKACDGLVGLGRGGAVTSEGSAYRDTETGRAHRLCDWNFYARRGDLTLFNLLTYLTHRHMHAHTLAIVGEQLQIKHIRSNRERRVR